MLYGSHGRYLKIDLTRRTTSVVPIPADWLRKYIGGGGLGTALLLAEMPPAANGPYDPLGASAPLLFVFSPLVGSPLTTSAKFSILSKSPLTNRLNDSLSSSHFAIAGKRTGYDALCIVGRSETPVSLLISPDEVRFEDAAHEWGHSSETTANHLRNRFGKEYRVAAIGIAGEHLVRYATISNEGRHAGRGGLGAVMGSKRLKAVAVQGDCRTPFAHPEELIQYSRDLSNKSLGRGTEKYRELGTVSNLLTFNRLGTLPTRNFQQVSFEGAEQIAPEQLSITRTRTSCAACTIGCEHIFQLESPTTAAQPVRMEYENLFALGPLCGISDPQVVLQASALSDEYGLDTISAGGSLAFAMECADRGLIDAPELRFGNGAALLEMLQQIATRTGLGAILAEGVRRGAEIIGQGSAEFAIHVKGLELPGYDPRALQAMALGFAVGTRGADHNRSGAYQVDFAEGTNRLRADVNIVQPAIETENEAALMDSLILCKFLRGVFEDKLSAMAEMLRLTTGQHCTTQELVQTAERIVTSRKLFNISQGWTAEEDQLPARFYQSPILDGPSEGGKLERESFQQLVHHYNQLRGWTASGEVPRSRSLQLEIPVELLECLVEEPV